MQKLRKNIVPHGTNEQSNIRNGVALCKEVAWHKALVHQVNFTNTIVQNQSRMSNNIYK